MARKRTLLEKLGENTLLFIIPFFTYGLLQILRLTMRIEEVNAQVLEPFRESHDDEPASIIAFWHSRLLMMPLLCRKRRITMLISQHRDGELISRAVRLFPVDSVRGSTTRGGVRALRNLVRALNGGSHVAFTPDGPRGPRQVAQKGALVVAAATGRPIVPVTFGASRKRIFNSWDRFVLPYPFSRGVFIWGEPISVECGESEAGIEEKRQLLETRLNQITAEAEHYFDP